MDVEGGAGGLPRPERPLESDDGPLTEFATDLRRLREKAGSPPYRELSRRAHYSSTTLSDAAGGRHLPSLAVTLAYVRACDGDVGEWEHRWQALAITSAAATPESADGAPPYVGLAAYQADDTEWFFGRERLVDELVSRVGAQRFVTVVGPSGAGKSSLLRAGLLPYLTARESTLVAVFTPGPNPVEECAIHVGRLLGGMPGAVTAELTDDPRNLHRHIRHGLVDKQDVEVVLVIDQFEEVFTLCHLAEERSRLIAALVEATGAANSRCRVVLGVRADFYSHCLLDADLAAVLRDGQVVVGPMSIEELRRAIVHPARRANCTVETSLVATLVAHANGRAGVLPLLSHVLLETWRRRQGNALTTAASERAGGIDGALAKTAEAVFTSLDRTEQETTRNLFLRLVALGEGTQDTKRRVGRDELDETADAVLTKLGAARLVVLSDGNVEITHEALIDAWPRLRNWLAEDREGQRVHRQLTEATATWKDHDHDPDTLLRGTRLAVIEDWARTHAGASQAEQAFLNASIAANEHERTTRRRRASLTRGLVAVVVVLLVIAAIAAVNAVNSRQMAANQRRDIAVALSAVRDVAELDGSKPALEAQISLAAYRLYPSQQTRDSLIATAAAATPISLGEGYWAPSLAPNGRLVAAVNRSADITVLSTVSGREVAEAATLRGGLFAAQFSTDSRIIATVDRNAMPRLWDISKPTRPRILATIPSKTARFTFSLDGSLLFTVDAIEIVEGMDPDPFFTPPFWAVGPTVRVWNIADAAAPQAWGALPAANSAKISFGVNRKIIAALNVSEPYSPSDRLANLWDITDPTMPLLATQVGAPFPDELHDILFVNKDQTMYTLNTDGVVEVWDVRSLGSPKKLSQIDDYRAVGDLISGPGGRTLITGTAERGGLAIWDISESFTPKKFLDLPLSGPGNLSDWTVSSDGKTVAAIDFSASGYSSYGTTNLIRWQLDAERSATTVCEQAASHMTEADWHKYFSDLPFQPPCG